MRSTDEQEEACISLLCHMSAPTSQYVPAGSSAAGLAASATGASLACTSAEAKPHYDPE